ncbi:MAG: hypothetical protein IIA72_24320, partial [Proteobacteria bacterium]|nr:hypothetical protein [Pseudomonadota bacterium]
MKSILSFAIITLPVLLFQLPLFAEVGIAKIHGTQGGSTIDGTTIFEEKPEEEELDPKLDQVRDNHGNRNDDPRKVDLPEQVGIGGEGR